ncbi:HAMP domain-containing histidine kinase [Novibacillus thermophilus]|uniref:HAMP domain-containing histidine kinase n=1 Tax=Novibacillus thermophilus TaxID=1471761 RepID=UPI001E638F53|nr:HAMP domain-containing histidine kinase [Novibacillus thermophilus]
MNIKTKIQLYTAIWLLLILLLISSAIYFLFYKLTTDTEVERVAAQTETIVEVLRADLDQPVQASDLFRAYMPANGMIRLINEAGEPVSTVTKEARLTRIPATFRTQQGSTFYTMEDGERYVIVYFPTIWKDGSIVTLEVTESLAPVQENMHTLRVVLTISSLMVLIPSIIGGRLLSNLILRPLKAIVGTMREIQERGVFKQIKLKGQSKDELYNLADTFNTMIKKLKTNFEKQEQFVSDASHELKTPLTVIDSYVTLLKRWGHRKPEVMDEAIKALSSETERMKSLIQQLLTLAKDESEGELKLEKVDLIALCRSTAERFRQTYEREIDVQTIPPTFMRWPIKQK